MEEGIRLGVFGARADYTGLAVQTYEFVNHLNPEKVMVVDITDLNKCTNDFSRYPDACKVKGFPKKQDIEEFCNSIDVLITFETPYNYFVFDYCRKKKIKTILIYNYEFLDYLQNPRLPRPDLLISPSYWHLDEVINLRIAPTVHIPYPINRQNLKFKVRNKIKKILHIVGKRAHLDRNGTNILLKAIPLVKSEVEFVIRTQSEIESVNDNRIKIIKDKIENYWELYNDEDLFVMPRKYGGLCLSLNESLSTGMIPLMPDISPQKYFLDKRCLLPPSFKGTTITRKKINYYEVSPESLAERIDYLVNLPENEIKELSYYSDLLASVIDWKIKKLEFEGVFKYLCRKLN